jgi:hypothetical protein
MSRPKKIDDEKLAIPEYKIKPLKQFIKPYVSPKTNSWEINWVSSIIKNWVTNPKTKKVTPKGKHTR